jgi:hypothetical protein
MPVHANYLEHQQFLSNFDVQNNTGQAANDFEVVLTGLMLGDVELGGFWTGSYPIVTHGPDTDGVKIRWSGSQTLNGDFAHFGVETPYGEPFDLNTTSTEFYWTSGENRLPNPPPSTWQNWDDVGGVRDVIRNYGSSDIWVQRRVLTVPWAVELDELMRDGDLWNAGIRIDGTSRVKIEAGLDLTYDFPIPEPVDPPVPIESYVMMYDVFDSSSGGSRSMTFLNAVWGCPEPSSIIALLCGLTGIGGLALRRRK